MDFTKDTTRQGKRLGEDVTSHSIVEKAKKSIFSINNSKPDLKLLKEAYGLLSSREKHDFELVPTIDEYHHFLRCSPVVDSSTFTLQAQHMKDNSYGFNWNAALMALGKRLKGITSSQRINFVALGIYGMVIFPIYVKTIAPMVVALFEQLSHTSTFNPASTVVVETLWSMKEIRVKRSGRFSGCIELFTIWAHGHLRGPQFEALFSVPMKDRKTEDWHRSLLAATVNDVGFVLPTWNATYYLGPPKGYHSIPLLGIQGGVTYSVELASRNLWEAKRSLEFAEEQRKKLLRVKADRKAKEKETKELVEKVIKQQELTGKVIKWRNAYNNLLSDYDALQKELQTARQSKQGEKESTT
ncbi:hypothetical protein SLEP1_g3765 [Rubroshorea leprosula]|uniref:DUF7745 domain-containing protein n=1 Tax=Rubroshorea leprosula TaxID=152421 RepID=A0AAV5HQU7_9ROSI|nr:hypothetical protein SLEP1_g3765 [Rubroshorea leprosula]